VTAKLYSTDLENICYVDVGLQALDDDKTIVNGLFLGIRPLVEVNTHLVSKDEVFVWLAQGDQVQTCNLFSYKISYIEVGYKISSVAVNIRTAKFDDLSQPKYREQLNEIVGAMKKANRIIGDDLIDTNTYTNIPSHIKHASFSSTAQAASSQSSKSKTCGYRGTSHAASGYKSAVKTISTTVIKRTTKYPITSAVGQLKAKIQALRDGIYEPPEINEPVEREVDEKNSNGDKSADTESANFDDDDYMLAHYGMV